jgi:hypothetical protein
MMVSKNPSSKLILVRSEEITVASCDAGEHVKELVCFSPAPLSAPLDDSVSQTEAIAERRERMQVVYERCCGLDVHQKTVVGCRLLSQPKGSIEKSIRTFATTTGGLMELDRWLAEGQVEQVALESTGIYWRPIFNLLEGHYEVLLVNAQHMHAIPGHKTDIKDSGANRSA